MKSEEISTIYFSRSHNRTSFTKKILQIFQDYLENSKKIFLKPNVVSYEPYPTTTHPEILETLLKHFSKCEIIIGDAPAIDAGRSNKIIDKSVLGEICKNHSARFVNLYSEKMKTVRTLRGYRMKISTIPLTCDTIISMPVLKTHFMVGLSGALKNQFGYLSKGDRLLMHSRIKNINKGIAEVNAVVPTNLFIVDAVETIIEAQELRHGGSIVKLGYLMAGTDPVALDCYGLQLLQELEPRFEENRHKAMKYIEYAETIGLGSKKHIAIEI